MRIRSKRKSVGARVEQLCAATCSSLTGSLAFGRIRKMATKSSALIDTRVIYCGDNLDQLRKFPSACVDLIYIDPPFNSNRNYEVFAGETFYHLCDDHASHYVTRRSEPRLVRRLRFHWRRAFRDRASSANKPAKSSLSRSAKFWTTRFAS